MSSTKSPNNLIKKIIVVAENSEFEHLSTNITDSGMLSYSKTRGYIKKIKILIFLVNVENINRPWEISGTDYLNSNLLILILLDRLID